MSEVEDAYNDIGEDLKWLIKVGTLGKGKADSIRTLAIKLAGEQSEHSVPLVELLSERRKRQAAEKKVAELTKPSCLED